MFFKIIVFLAGNPTIFPDELLTRQTSLSILRNFGPISAPQRSSKFLTHCFHWIFVWTHDIIILRLNPDRWWQCTKSRTKWWENNFGDVCSDHFYNFKFLLKTGPFLEVVWFNGSDVQHSCLKIPGTDPVDHPRPRKNRSKSHPQ